MSGAFIVKGKNGRTDLVCAAFVMVERSKKV